MPPPKTAPQRTRKTAPASSTSASSGRRTRTDRSPISGWRRLTEIGLLGVLLVAPLFMGGRHPLGQFALVLLIAFTFLAWLVPQCVRRDAKWKWTGAEGVLALGFLLVLAQLASWPVDLLAKLSPATSELLPLWTAENAPWYHLGNWTSLSLAPTATQEGLVMFMAYCLLFFLVVQYVRDLQDVQRVMRWVACAAIGMAALGLAQYFLSNGKYLWIYTHPMRDTSVVVKGTFLNENHFTHFVAMGLAPLIWWLRSAMIDPREGGNRFAFTLRGLPPDAKIQKASVVIGLGCVCLAGLLSFSRGGVLVMFFTAAATVGLFASASLLGRRAIGVLAGVGVLLGVSLLIFGWEKLSGEIGSLAKSQSLSELLDVRLTLWKAMLQAHEKFRWFGTGVGSHAEVYLMFFPDYSVVEYTHGESGYFHLLEETGLLGLGLMLAGIAYCLWCCRCAFQTRQDQELRSCAFVVLASLLTSIIHSFIDFVWYIPACMSLAIVFAALACRLSQLAIAANQEGSVTEIAFSPGTWRMGTALIAGVLALMVLQTVRPALASFSWDQYLRISLAYDPAIAPSGDDAEAMLSELEKVLDYEPQHARAHLRYASLCLLRFEQKQRETDNAMSVTQIREAAFASKFPSKEAQLLWLKAAFAENVLLLQKAAHHARQSVKFCPLQGEAYLLLGELAFLDSPLPLIKRNYLAQALRVRPYHGGILAALGGEAAMDGDTALAMRFWTVAFRQDPVQRGKLMETLGKQLSAEFLIEQLQPNLEGMRVVYQYYGGQGRTDDAKFAGQKLAVLLEADAADRPPAKAILRWREARDVYGFLKDSEKALACAKNTIGQDATDFSDRFEFANLLLNCDHVDEAIQELQWCKSRKPDHAETLNALNVAIRRRVAEKATPVSHKSTNTRAE